MKREKKHVLNGKPLQSVSSKFPSLFINTFKKEKFH